MRCRPRVSRPTASSAITHQLVDLDLRLHGLWHTCVTLLLDLGVPPRIVMEIACHSDHGVTMQVSAHARWRRSGGHWTI